MSKMVSISRAAKLVGLSRGALQKKIHDHELESFEGEVRLTDIERIFPDAQIEDNHIMEDMERIIERALKKARGEKLATLLAPDAQTLAARLHAVSREHAHTVQQLHDLTDFMKSVQSRIQELASTPGKTYQFEDLVNLIDDTLEKVTVPRKRPVPLVEKNTILRVLAAQVHIKNSGHEFFIEGNNSILEAGLSAGLALNYGCSNGNCGKCKAKLVSGEIRKIKPHDYTFTESEKLQDYFLCCSNTAVTDCVIEAEEAGSAQDIPEQNIAAKVKKIENLNENILILNLKTPRTNRLRFLAGQSVRLSRAEQPAIEFPIASCPCDDMNIQFHIPANVDNEFVHYLENEATSSDAIHIEGPTGSFVLDENSNLPLVFIAFDTGFAPVKSLIEHAVTLEHAEYIQLYWYTHSQKPYLHNHCRAWSDALDDLNYRYDSLEENKLSELLKRVNDTNSSKDILVYIAGNSAEVNETKTVLTGFGVAQENIKQLVMED